MSFEQFLQQKGIIPKTISRHQREVSKYENWLKLHHDKTPENAAKKDVLNYLAHIKESRSLCNTSQDRVLNNLKNYYSYLSKKNGTQNITSFIKIRGTNRKYLRPLFTPEELDLLCDAYYYHTQQYTPSNKELRFYPDNKKQLQGRYIILTLMAYQALQLHEIEALTQSSFDLHKATVTIHQSRMGAARKLPLQAAQIGALIAYCNGEDTPLTPSRNHFERLNRTLKTLHTKYRDFTQIRASKISHWIKQYGLRKAQYLAGHKHIQTTEKHLAGEFETLQNDLNNFHPLS